MPSPLARRVARAIETRGLWLRGDRVAVALSGGADSVALLLLLAELSPKAPWTLAGAIHVNHGLRGEDSELDEEFCRRLASDVGVPIDVVSVDVAGAMASARRSMEATARVLRYQAFEAAAGRLEATVVATGHTLDDQAETVLLRLLRGATARGVSAIRPRRGLYARPVLDCRRADLRRYVQTRRQDYREDASNADSTIARNRLRHELMPVIERAWPGGAAALARFAELALDDERWLSTQAAAERPSVIRSRADGVEVIRERLVALDPAIARRVVRDAIEQVGGTPTFREVEAIRRLARPGGRGSQLDLRSLRVERAKEVLWLRAPTPAHRVPAFEYRLDVPGAVDVSETGTVIRASFVVGSERPAVSEGWDAAAVLSTAGVALPLTVRNRRPGDRFRPLGAPGSRTLQNLLVDRKVPRQTRSAIPVVVDADGHIVWVVGVAMAERCRVRSPQAGMVILEAKKGTL